MNDSNGMFYVDGKFHLYFQHHPDSNVWGPMHWGHATSEDLMNWEEHEIALFPDELGTIFSGSAVVDYQNGGYLEGYLDDCETCEGCGEIEIDYEKHCIVDEMGNLYWKPDERF